MKTWDIDDKVDAVYEMRMEQVNHAMRTGGPAAGGLTVRDYFAAKMAVVMFASCEQDPWTDFQLTDWDYDSVASASYEFADAMMRERDRKHQEPCSVEEAFGL